MASVTCGETHDLFNMCDIKLATLIIKMCDIFECVSVMVKMNDILNVLIQSLASAIGIKGL